MGDNGGGEVALRGERPNGEGIEDEGEQGEEGIGGVGVFKEVVIEGVIGLLLLPTLAKVELVLVLDAEVLAVVVVDPVDQLHLLALREELQESLVEDRLDGLLSCYLRHRFLLFTGSVRSVRPHLFHEVFLKKSTFFIIN